MKTRTHKLVVASNNSNKIVELRSLLQGLDIEFHLLKDLTSEKPIKETGSSFKENAVLKAEYGCKLTNLPTIADDSGLEVQALNGAPGIYSRRFAGEDADDIQNNRFLLQKIEGLEADKRQACFSCAIALARPGKTTLTFNGTCSGFILTEACGEGGFGYDPLFFSTELACSFSVASSQSKNQVSHRGRALQELKNALQRDKLL